VRFSGLMMQPRLQHHKFWDGLIEHGISVDHNPDGFQISRVARQDCSAIIEHNREVMAAGGSRTASFGKVELSIPELELRNLKKRYPDLAAPDMQIRVRAWKRFIRSAESKPWRVSQRKYN